MAAEIQLFVIIFILAFLGENKRRQFMQW